MKKKISALIGVLLCFTILFSSITVFAGDFVDHVNPSYQARVETLGFPIQDWPRCFISADTDGNLHYIGATYNFSVVTFEYHDVMYGIYCCSEGNFSVYDASLSSDWSLRVSQSSPLYVAFGPEPFDNKDNFWNSAVDAGKVSSSGWKYCMYGGNQLVYDGGSAGVDLIYLNYFDNYPWYSPVSSVLDYLKLIGSTFLASFISPLISVIIAEPVLFVIVLVGFSISVITLIYGIFSVLSSRKKSTRVKRRKKRG